VEKPLKISVIVPVYNGEKFLLEALKSIERQTCQPWEIVIGDNASTDQTLGIAQEFAKLNKNVKLIKQENNIGFARNINSLVSAASGDFIFILCHDDLIDERYIELMSQVVVEETVDLVFSDFYEIDEQGKILDVSHFDAWRDFVMTGDKTLFSSEELLREILRRRAFPFTITSLIRKNLFSKLSGFSSTYRFSADNDFYLRYLLAGTKICYLREKLFLYRRHSLMDTNEGIRTQRLPDEVVYIFTKHLTQLIPFANENKYLFAIRFYKAALKRIITARITGQYPIDRYWEAFTDSIKKFIWNQK
jgi:teichuronic acid biosynthesis glycosyltransferase TuaG